ncbi:Thiamine-phosphate synthase [Verrucomicrobia bacterium]|nr:Thiamine-phosphate synthase [Verrucomicrobiota bacterium]
MKPISECRLYTFVDTGYLRGRSPAAVAEELCEGGADLIQLRAKQVSLDEVRRLAEAVRLVTLRADVGLVVNDHPAIAQAVGADFCHLGQEDFFGAHRSHVSELGAALVSNGSGEHGRPAVRVGLSTHSPEQANRAVAAGAHYLGVGPVYPTGTKPGAAPVTLSYVRWAAEHVRTPWFAIGGITLENLDAVLGAGGRRVCVVSAILQAPDIVDACRQFKRRLGEP